jgi:pimeloyl-ACP methyl ester carboxylesterase
VLGGEFAPAVATPEMAAAALESRWAPLESKRIHYVAAGRAGAPPLLLVHGSPGTWEAWGGYLRDPELRDQARLLAVDRPGFGGTARGRAEPSLARQAAALAAVLAAEGGGPAVVAGHSLGGPIAVRLAVDRPELVRALVLVAPSIDPALEERRWFHHAGSWRAVQWFLPVDWITSNREIWPLRDELAALAARLGEVRVPVTVIQGEADELVPAANADFVARAFAAAPVAVERHPELGHFLLWQRPELVRRALLASLAASPDRSATVYRAEVMRALEIRGAAWSLVLLAAAVPAVAQESVVEERVEVIEVGVLADLPPAMRGRGANDLAGRLVITEDGVRREPVSVAKVGGTGTDAYGRVLVVVDLVRCSPEMVAAAPAALGAQAERLAALGPVEVALLRDDLEPFGAPTRSAAEAGALLARVAREVTCGPPPAPDRLERIEIAAERLVCPARPCLIAWAGPGWGQAAAADGVAPPPDAAAVEPLAKRLAAAGWALLAVPLASAEPGAPKRHAPEPNYRPESGTYTFGINVLGRRDKKPLTEQEATTLLDVWLAPLRRLVAATAGEFVASVDRLPDALDDLAGRSILYYRTARRTSAEPPRLEVKAPGETGRSYRTPEWGPANAE